jgi:hypothetical protein
MSAKKGNFRAGQDPNPMVRAGTRSFETAGTSGAGRSEEARHDVAGATARRNGSQTTAHVALDPPAGSDS